MEKGDSLPLRTHARRLIDKANSLVAAAREGTVEILNGEADVMNSRTAALEKFRDRRVGRARLEKLDQLVTGGKTGNAGPIGVVERMLVESEEISIERQHLVDRAYGDSNVRDARSTTRGGWHENRAPFMV